MRYLSFKMAEGNDGNFGCLTLFAAEVHSRIEE